VRVAALVDENWADAWRVHFKPRAVGRRLLIAPPWDLPAPNGRIVIEIEPGRAFGTGHHGTTAGCLEALEAAIERDPPSRMLDVGTGSGILAIAAARLGVASVLAVDDDPDAVACAMANAARNHVSDRVRCALADAATLREPRCRCRRESPLGRAPPVGGTGTRRSLTPGGTLLLGGILDAEPRTRAGALADHGLIRSAASRSVEGWTTARAPSSARLRIAPSGSATAASSSTATRRAHLARVLRLRSGDTVVAADGAGREYTVRLETLGRGGDGHGARRAGDDERESPVRMHAAPGPSPRASRWSAIVPRLHGARRGAHRPGADGADDRDARAPAAGGSARGAGSASRRKPPSNAARARRSAVDVPRRARRTSSRAATPLICGCVCGKGRATVRPRRAFTLTLSGGAASPCSSGPRADSRRAKSTARVSMAG
jgi:hypothetical protein